MSLRKIFLVFLKIGFTAFGGPAAHAALMEQELVTRRKWLTTEIFLDFLGAVNLIPGPNSTQLTMLTGYKLRGFSGMLAAGMGFILPAALITGLLAWLYVSMGQIPAVEALFFGIKPAVIAVIAGAILKLGRKALKNMWLALLGCITLAATLSGLNEITAILGAGVLGIGVFAMKTKGEKRKIKNDPRKGESADHEKNHSKTQRSAINAVTEREKKGREGESRAPEGTKGRRDGGKALSLSPVVLGAGVAVAGLASYSLLKLFWVFLKIGAVLFGTGYVLVAYMDGELVEKLGWLTREQLLDAIAIGQFTPGPILSAATFVGYLFDGVPGALVATLGIFLPSFAYIMVLYPIIPRLRKNPYSGAFLDAVNVGAVAVMLSVSLVMAAQVLNILIETDMLTVIQAIDWRAGAIMALALAVVFSFRKASAVWVILGGALLGIIIGLF